MTDLSHAHDPTDDLSRAQFAPSSDDVPRPRVEFEDNVRILEPRRRARASKKAVEQAVSAPASEPVGESEHFGPVRSAALTVEDAKRIAAQAHVVAQTGSTLGTWNPVQRRAKKKQAEEAERRLTLIRERAERERKAKAERSAKEPREPKAVKVPKPEKAPKPAEQAAPPQQESPSAPPLSNPPPAPRLEVARAVVIDKRATARQDAEAKAAEKAATKAAAAQAKADAAAAKKAAQDEEAACKAELARQRREARAAAKVQVAEHQSVAPVLGDDVQTPPPPPSGAPVDLPPPPSAAPVMVTEGKHGKKEARKTADAETGDPTETAAAAGKGRDWHKIFFGTSKQASVEADGEVIDVITAKTPKGSKPKDAVADPALKRGRGKKAEKSHLDAAVFDPKAREVSGAVGVTVRVSDNTSQLAPAAQPEAVPAPEENLVSEPQQKRVAVFAPVSGGAVRAVNQPKLEGSAPVVAAPVAPAAPTDPSWDAAFLPPLLVSTMGEDINWMRVRRPAAASMAALTASYVRSLDPTDPIVGVTLRAVSRALRPQPTSPSPVSADQVAYEAAARPSGGRRRKDGPPMLGAEGAREAAALGRRIESGQGGTLVNAADAAELIARLSDTWDVASVLRHPEITTWAYDEAVVNVQASPRPRRGKGPDKKKVLAELTEAKRILDGIQAEQLIATTHV